MPPEKTTRQRPQRARIDAILNAIRKGDYDDKLAEIRAAVDDRYAEKRAEVEKLVKEVYGEDYIVTPQVKVNPVYRNAPSVVPGTPPETPAPEGWQDVTEQLTQEASTAPPEMPQEDDPDIESRSPIIGGLTP